jgi:hypothetical protein
MTKICTLLNECASFVKCIDRLNHTPRVLEQLTLDHPSEPEILDFFPLPTGIYPNHPIQHSGAENQSTKPRGTLSLYHDESTSNRTMILSPIQFTLGEPGHRMTDTSAGCVEPYNRVRKFVSALCHNLPVGRSCVPGTDSARLLCLDRQIRLSDIFQVPVSKDCVWSEGALDGDPNDIALSYISPAHCQLLSAGANSVSRSIWSTQVCEVGAPFTSHPKVVKVHWNSGTPWFRTSKGFTGDQHLEQGESAIF